MSCAQPLGSGMPRETLRLSSAGGSSTFTHPGNLMPPAPKCSFMFENSFMLNGKNYLIENLSDDEYHLILYIMSVFHELIKESITRDYEKEKFLEVCNMYIDWLLGGIL